MRFRKAYQWSLIVLLCFSVGFVSNVSENYFEISKNLEIFGKLYREINSLYVEDTDPTELMRTGIDAMLNTLDPYTSYISEDEVEEVKFMSTGQYGGIGALIGKRRGKIVVLEPYKEYPADEAGLKAGDELISIDGQALDAANMEVVDIRNLLRGDQGTRVVLTVERVNQSESISFEIERDRIKVKNVPYYGTVDPEVAYIYLEGFTQDAGVEVEEALQTLKAENPMLKGVILDLRGNPGGRLDEAVNTANVFISQKEKVVETRGRIEGSHRVHHARLTAVDTEIPLAVIVNSRSASASEIVAGAIQDLDRGVIVGERSFGKGLVQNIRPLSYNAQLKVTTAKYYTPSGRCIQAIDYADRNAKGAPNRIPDSLRTAFKTRSGRVVYDGGGIQPDIPVSPLKLTAVARALREQGYIFSFATLFYHTHSEIANPRDFEISEALYDEFVAYVEKDGFDYNTRADRQFDRLKSTLEDEGYYNSVSDDLTELSDLLQEQKDKDLLKHKEEIAHMLRMEIVKRYYYEEGMIEASFQRDRAVSECAQLLKDGVRYAQLLSGSMSN